MWGKALILLGFPKSAQHVDDKLGIIFDET